MFAEEIINSDLDIVDANVWWRKKITNQMALKDIALKNIERAKLAKTKL